MDAGGYKVLTTRHDSIGSSRLVPTLVDSTQWKSIGTNLTEAQKNEHQDRNMSKSKHDTRILCITRSINVCKQMIRFKRFFTALVSSRFKKRRAANMGAIPGMIQDLLCISQLDTSRHFLKRWTEYWMLFPAQNAEIPAVWCVETFDRRVEYYIKRSA